jgi:hypothetical protein
MRNPAIPTLPYNNMGKTKLYKNKMYEVSQNNNEENKFVFAIKVLNCTCGNDRIMVKCG